MNLTQLFAAWLYALAVQGRGGSPEHDSARRCLLALAQGWNELAWHYQNKAI